MRLLLLLLVVMMVVVVVQGVVTIMTGLLREMPQAVQRAAVVVREVGATGVPQLLNGKQQQQQGLQQ
jgi:hypothetical protein